MQLPSKPQKWRELNNDITVAGMPVFDVMLAVIVTLIGTTLPFSFGYLYGFETAVYFGSSLLMTMTLALRRTHPMLMLALMTLSGFLQLIFFSGPLVAIIAVPIACYSIARWVTGREARYIIYIGLTASILGPARWVLVGGYNSGSIIFGVVFLSLSCAAAVVVPYLIGRRVLENNLANQDRAWASQAVAESELARREQAERFTEARVRSEIARELHDIVAHSLSVIIVQADGGKAMLGKNKLAETDAALNTISETGREALTEMRRIVGVLRDGTEANAEFVPNPGLGDIPAMVAKAGERVELITSGNPPVVPATLALTVYRIVQEGVTNFLKHAGPDARAQVRITYGSRIIEVLVADNGHGSKANSDGMGNGQRGMYERVSAMGGVLRTGPGLGGGYLVQAVLPVPEDPYVR